MRQGADGGDARDCKEKASGVAGSTDLDEYLGHEKVPLTEPVSHL